VVSLISGGRIFDHSRMDELDLDGHPLTSSATQSTRSVALHWAAGRPETARVVTI
jgi:hypothetical protein